MQTQLSTLRLPSQYIDSCGVAILSYPVATTSRRVQFDTTAVRALDAARVNRLFHLNRNGAGQTYIRARTESGEVVVLSRIILGALPSQHVHHIDDDPFNLRSTNLSLIEGRRCGNDCTAIKLSALDVRQQAEGRQRRAQLESFQ